jgi:antitoxin FitA
MAKTVQIHNVPDELHRTLKTRAAKAGMTLSDYLLSEIEQIAERPTLAEMMERLRQREPVQLDEPPDMTIPAASVRLLNPLRLQLRRPTQRLEDHAVLLRLAPQILQLLLRSPGRHDVEPGADALEADGHFLRDA